MRLDSGEVPEWPGVHGDTPEEAMIRALPLMEPGDIFWVHQESCAMAYDRDCDCVVTLVPYPNGVQ